MWIQTRAATFSFNMTCQIVTVFGRALRAAPPPAPAGALPNGCADDGLQGERSRELEFFSQLLRRSWWSQKTWLHQLGLQLQLHLLEEPCQRPPVSFAKDTPT